MVLTASSDCCRAGSSSKIFIAGLALNYSQPMIVNGAFAQAFTLTVKRASKLLCFLRRKVHAFIRVMSALYLS